MVNINCSNLGLNESIGGEKFDKYNDLIWTMKAVDYMNEENQENLNRVHVLCCIKCDFLTISLMALQQHMLLLHYVPTEDFNNLTIYYCQECKCVSTEFKLIYEHIKIFHQISTENSSNSSTSGIVHRKTKILTPSVIKNARKSTHAKMIKTQMKVRQHIFKQKCLKMKTNNLISTDIDNSEIEKRDIKKEAMQPNDSREMSQTADENDPLDMSINSTTCPFKAIKLEGTEENNFSNSSKMEPVLYEDYNSWNNNNNNTLLSNPQTCIELIKLTLSQMLDKTAEQNHLSQIAFNPSSFLTQQFPLSSNVVPLLLSSASKVQNNDESFVSKHLCKSVNSKSLEHGNQMVSFLQSPLFLDHKLSNIVKFPFTESSSTNGTPSIPGYSPKKSGSKRGLKKPAPTAFNDEGSKSDTANCEQLFNRSFLDSSEQETIGDNCHFDLSTEHDHMESLTMQSDKSSPNEMSTDKPHRQNFTSQQNRILSDWFFTHCDKPYPSTEDTKDLSLLSGLTYSQVKKWFANKRARSSLNKKNHKNYCPGAPTDGTVNNDHDSVSPSTESHKSYPNLSDVPLAINFPSSNPSDVVEMNIN